MAFIWRIFSKDGGTKPTNSVIQQDVDPTASWDLIGELGDGAFGKVYKTQNKKSKELAAMKSVEIKDGEELTDFTVEIDILSECQHPNIVKLLEAFFYQEKLYLFIEFCPGGAMDNILLELGHGLEEMQIRCISKQLFSALHFLHSNRCIHRDLKAGNILLCPDGSIRLADFGVSAKNKKTANKRATFIGTPYWMAPEVIACEITRDTPYDYKSDIWSAAITCIELAEMHPPHHEMNPMRVLVRIPRSDPPTLQDHNKWSDDFHSFLAKCLVKQPLQRPSAKDVLDHQFLNVIDSHRPLLALFREVRAEVTLTVEPLPEDRAEKEDTASSASSGEGGAVGPESLLGVDPGWGTDQTEFDPPSKSRGAKPRHDSSLSEGRKYQTISRVRTFEVDGQVMTSTIRRIVDPQGNEIDNNKRFQLQRKQDLREIRVLQREEQKECQALADRIESERDALEKKYEARKAELTKSFESTLDAMSKKNHREIEKLESTFAQEMKQELKRIKQMQTKDLKTFQASQKAEEKQVSRDVKEEVERSLPKVEQKQVLRRRLSDIQGLHAERESSYRAQLMEDVARLEAALTQKQKDDRRSLELKCLLAKHDLTRKYESDAWDLERTKLQEKHQLTKKQLEEAFLLHRHQMAERHKKELEQHERLYQLKYDDLQQQHQLQRRQYPRQLKVEHRNHIAELKRANRGRSDMSPIRQAEDGFSQMYQARMEEMMDRQDKEEEALNQEAKDAIRELEAIQLEKKQHLGEQEERRMRDKDAQHSQEMKDWRSSLSTRKKQLETQCNSELEQLRVSYAAQYNRGDAVLLASPSKGIIKSLSNSYFPEVTEEEQRARALTNAT